MLDSTGSLVLITGAGLLLLRPGDFPLFARIAGRVAGLSVRGLRSLRQVTEEVLARGEQELGSQGGNVSALKEDLRQSLSHFDSLRMEVARDVRNFGRFAPAEMIRSRLTSSALQPKLMKRLNEEVGEELDEERAALKARKLPSLSRASDRADTTAGVDFIARSIEEAALAKQHQRIFGGQAPLSSSNAPAPDSSGSQLKVEKPSSD